MSGADTNDSSAIDSLYIKGLALDNQGKHVEAITYYDKVLAIDPNDKDVLHNKQIALSKMGQ